MGVGELVESRLRAAFSPSHLEVVDDSAAHAAHGPPGIAKGAHVKVVVVSEAFAGKTPIQRHRMVNELFKEELQGAIHALQIVARAPGERLG
jgi:BolA family transcriptional regulator, general stress-responsive regulator